MQHKTEMHITITDVGTIMVRAITIMCTVFIVISAFISRTSVSVGEFEGTVKTADDDGVNVSALSKTEHPLFVITLNKQHA